MEKSLAGGSVIRSGKHGRCPIWTVAVLAVVWCAQSLGQPTAAGYRTDRIIVKAVDGADDAALARLHANIGGSVAHRFAHPARGKLVQLRAGLSVAEAVAAYKQSGLVDYAEPDFLLQALIAPNDFHYGNQDQWNLHNTGVYGGVVGADIMAEAGWDLQREAPNIIVAVIDTGVRYTHEDLAANMWVNPGESGLDASGRDKRTNRVDDDGNGYVDDVHGINVLNGTGDPADDWGHGSHVAGIVGAVTNNSVGVAGVAWRVKIMACKFIDTAGVYSVSDAIKCLEYARVKGARIINASWGNYSFTSAALQDSFAALRSAGIIVTAAAGNDNSNNDLTPLYPANYDFDNIISVAATDRTDARAGFSNYGALTVDLGAPGAPVFSTWAGNDWDYRYNDGTSMAAPHLAGACALLWTRFPADTHTQLIQRILSTVDPLPGLTGLTRTGGRLNLAAALASGSAPPPPPPSPPAAPSGLTATAASVSTVNLTWTDNSNNETGFQIERSTDNATFASAGSVGANVNSATSTGLAAATTYYFRVRAVQDSAASGYSNTANATTPAAPPPPPAGSWQSSDIGAVGATGSASESGGTLSLTGSGADIWDNVDEFRYRYQSWTGDGEIIARVTSLTNTHSWAKAGLMFRETLAANSRHALMCISSTNGTALQSRAATGGGSASVSGGGSALPRWLRLVRSGNTFTGYESLNGSTWTLVGSVTLAVPATIFVGQAVTSHNDGVLCTATFDQVSLAGSGAPPPTPVAPTGLTATAASSSQINLAWTDASNNETGFQIERSTDNVNFALTFTTAANATSYADTGRPASTTYYYRVRAANGTTTFSSYSNTASATTSAPPPATVAAPTGLTATAFSSAQINLAWTDASGNETGFQVERSTDNVNFALAFTAAANATSYADTGRTASTAYHYRVRAANGTTFSPYSNTASATTLAAPPAGSWLRADVGSVGVVGSDDSSGTTLTVRGSGSDVWGSADAFRFVYREITGDFTIEAQVSSLTNTHAWAKGGVMVRDSLAANARNVFTFMTPSNGVLTQVRQLTGGSTTSTAGPWWVTPPYWVRITRTGNRFVTSSSADGTTWTQISAVDLTLNATVSVGLAVTSHDNSRLATGVFTNPVIR